MISPLKRTVFYTVSCVTFLIFLSACKQPKANFSWVQSALGEVILQNTSVNYKRSRWELSNGTTSNENFLRAKFVRGTYEIKLTVWGRGFYGGREYSIVKILDYQGGPFFTAQTPKGNYEANLL